MFPQLNKKCECAFEIETRSSLFICTSKVLTVKEVTFTQYLMSNVLKDILLHYFSTVNIGEVKAPLHA